MVRGVARPKILAYKVLSYPMPMRKEIERVSSTLPQRVTLSRVNKPLSSVYTGMTAMNYQEKDIKIKRWEMC